MRDYLQIHNKWYDVTDFKHPGGPVSIGLGLGRDATALFEAHHPFTQRSKLKAYLQKYEVPESEVKKLNLRTFEQKSKRGQVEIFDWGTGGIDREQDPFEKEVKEEVYNYFKAESEKRGITFMQAIKATPFRWFTVFSLMLLTALTIPFFVTGSWWTLFVTPALFWLVAAHTSHDTMHFACSTDWRINWILQFTAPFTSSPFMWYHQHVIGHHAYPNVAFKDPDIAHAPSLMRVHESISWKKSHTYQLITTPIIWTLGATLYMTLVPIKAILKGTFNSAVPLKYMSRNDLIKHLLGRVLTAASLWTWPWFVFPVWQALIWCFVPMFVHSLCFMASTQLNHLTPVNAFSSDSNYYKHQVVTSHSFGPESKLLFFFTGGLNLQIEHHLFPTVNHCHLPALHYIIKTACANHNVPYHRSEGFNEAIGKYVDHLRFMARDRKSVV